MGIDIDDINAAAIRKRVAKTIVTMNSIDVLCMADDVDALIAEVERLTKRAEAAEGRLAKMEGVLRVFRHYDKDNSWGRREALNSAISFIEKRFLIAPCDSAAVSECLRCNAVFLAGVVRDVLAALDQEPTL